MHFAGALEDFDKPSAKVEPGKDAVAAPDATPADAEWNEEFLR